ncbi:MAG: oxygen-independent coproporphyrinogen III oxidase [Pseudomonadota bacterium]
MPRYTSYPTAPHFQTGIGETLGAESYATLDPTMPVSVYVHIPFCDKLCWFCGCNTKHTLRYEPIESYIDSLIHEIKLLGAALPKDDQGQKLPVAHLHFGGGSPSMIRAKDAARLGKALRGTFSFADGKENKTEISIEIDPTDVIQNQSEAMDAFAHLGMTRASIGVQDFDPIVQKAINRPQSFEDTTAVVELLRGAGIHSLNIDALYGLPHQTLSRVRKTIDQVISLEPDRVALFGYAHVPWVKKHQNMIAKDTLPGTAERLDQAGAAAMELEAAGYQTIGIDHFAKPTDTLSQAAQDGSLRRNFQGYTTDTCDTLIGLGASSIGKSQHGFIQNCVSTHAYKDKVANGNLPFDKGYRLTQDDIIRAYMIEQLMCHLRVSFEALTQRFGAAATPYIAELKRVGTARTFDTVDCSDTEFSVQISGRAYVRLIAAQFDAYLPQSNFRFSKAV